MKKIIYTLAIGLVLISCNKSDDNNSNCNFLLNVTVNYPINLNLPQFNNLLFTQSPVLINGEGNGGIVVMKTLGENYVAWDAADPNHPLESCSFMTLEGTTLTSTCDGGNIYDINTGLPLTENLACALKPYRAEQSGNTIFISN